MYDRKTWIVVIVCSILLAINLNLQQKEARRIAEQKRLEAPEQVTPAPGPSPSPASPVESPGSLVEAVPTEQVVEQLVKLETPEMVFTFTSIGGGLKHAEFKNQKHGTEGPVRLNRHGASPIGAIAEGPDVMEALPYEFVPLNPDTGRAVVMTGRLPSGLKTTKTWSLIETGDPSDPYRLDLQIQLENAGETTVNLESFSLFLGTAAPLDLVERPEQTGFVMRNDRDFSFTASTSFAGGWFSKEKTLITEPLERADYAGVANQFFATVVKPVEPGASLLWSKVSDVTLAPGSKPVKAVRAGLRFPSVVLAPGEKRPFSYQVFAGPKENRMLRKMGDDWGEMMNYGWFSPFSRFMNWSLWWVHAGMEKISGKWSWGLAVVVLTILLRVAIWPLYNRSNRTMKRMAKLKPEMDKLKEKYPDDVQKQQQEMMKLYRTYGVNPLGGCLPMFAQLPIFFGFYSMLLHAVEMRGQSFMWVGDLSLPDTLGYVLGIPINPLPIVMAITSFAQMAMMPNTGGDKTQMMIIKLMPFLFLFICYNFASALALYWTVSNIFSIGQTWLSNRMPEPVLKAKAGGGGKSFVERMAERADQAQKMRQAKGRVVDPKDDGGASKKRPPRTGG